MQESSSDTTVRRIGKYEVTGELGHGGMAVVYRARDTQLLRDVAIKILHPHLANDPESRQRFLREAQAAARLRHPNIVEVFDFSVETDRESFMVSELLEGPTLRRFAEQHPGMPAEIVAAVGVVLCDALECAHGQGVIHRDVKPDNVLLQKGGVLKLTDFGIAHVSDGGQMTQTGQVLGSPAHMAPEQIEGRSVDPRTDLFAVGTVLYVLAVGRLPFEASHPHALLRKILETDYPDPLRVAPGIGHRFAAIIRKCLERDVNNRWQNAGELRAALMAYVAEVGWDETATPLRKYLGDPDGYVPAHRTALIEKLPELGVVARREGRATDALGYFNRALALEPSNARVLGLVRGIARRRQMRRSVSAVFIVASAAAVSALGVVYAAKRIKAHSAHGATGVVVAQRVARPVVRPAPVGERAMANVAIADAAVRVAERAPVPGTPGPNASAAHPAAVVAVHTPVRPTVGVINPRIGRTEIGAVNAQSAANTRPDLVAHVALQISPLGTRFEVDNGPWTDFDFQNLELRPGPHRFRVVGNQVSCNPYDQWHEVAPGDSTLRLAPECSVAARPGTQSAAAAP